MKTQANLLKDYTTTVTILEHLSDAIFILNAAGQIEYANKVALDLLRAELPAILGQRLDHFLIWKNDGDFAGMEDPGQELMQKIYQQPFNEVEVSIASNQYHTPVVISFGLVRNNAGEINFIIASAKDITLRAELERDQQHQQLLNFSRGRYRELGELAVNMVHNLSQPVTSIRLLAELIQKIIINPQSNPEQINKNLTAIINSLDSMTTSIANVRNFAFQTEDESLKLVDITLSLRSAIQQFEYELTDKNIIVEINQHDPMPLILANPIHLQQVFVSLIKILKVCLTAPAIRPDVKKKIFIELANVENKWLSINVFSNLKYDSMTMAISSGDTGQTSTIPAKADPELSFIRLIITSLGGDISSKYHERPGDYEFVLRLPVDQKEERAQLFNLIELLRQ